MMKKNIITFLIILICSVNTNAQLSNGSIAPDFTVNDLNGVSHNLYEYLDAGITVFLDFSAVWCGPCWNYHTSHALKEVYEDHGPSGLSGVSQSTTNDVMVFFIEGQAASLAELNGGGSSLGDWVTGTPYPIICTDPASGLGNSSSICQDFDTPHWPTVYRVCPDRTITEIGQAQNLYSLVTDCLPPPSQNNDARSFMNSSPSSGCSSVSPEISIQNYGLNNLTEVRIDVSLNGVLQYTTIFDEVYDNLSNSWQSLNLSTLDLKNVILDEITGLVNNDIITIDVSMPNGIVDTDPTNDQTISYIVDLGFDNAFWDGPLSITVDGGPQNSWYLKQVSSNSIIASGFGNVTGVTNSIDLTFNECYTLQSINGANFQYNVTDALGQILLEGSASGVEDFDNFTTGNQIWTGTNNYIESQIKIFPIPAKNQLYVEGEYDYLIIIDLLGNKIIKNKHQNDAIDVSELKNGIYIIEFDRNGLKTYANLQINK